MEIKKVLALRGPNVWANFPCLEAWVELGPYQELSSELLPGFNDRLMGWLPSMIEHRCSVGERGGFFERLRRGTYLGHILEHVTLELQTLAGHEVGFGRARETTVDGTYRVAIQYVEEQVGRAAIEVAHRLIMSAINGQAFDVNAEVETLREMIQQVGLGPSTNSIVQAAKLRGIPVRRLNADSLVQLGYGTKQRRICAAETDRTGAIAEAIAQDKEMTRKLLKGIGVPVPEGRAVENRDDAWEAAKDIDAPVVVKPQYGNHGRGVTTNLTAEDQVKAAYDLAREHGRNIIVEKYAPGADYRLLVIGNRMVAAARREPAHVIGDGVHTIAQLVEVVNRDPRRSDGHSTVLSKIKLCEIALATLAENGYTPESVPAVGTKVVIRRNANLSTGGTAIDVTDIVHPLVAEHAVWAARVIGLDIAGIDVIVEDITRPLEEQNGIICEVNAGPGLRMHLQPSEGEGRPVGEAIINMMFPEGDNGRIPIVSVTGVNGKTTTTRLIAHIQSLTGKTVGMTCTDGIYIGSRRIDTGDCSGPKSAAAVLMHPAVEAAVLETARGGILREGLAFDRTDVAVVTNIGEGDHLGLHDIDTIEKLAKVKRCLVDVVPLDGAAVLNAEDPHVVAMAEYCKGSVVWFAHDGNHPELVKRRADGGRVVFVRENAIVLADGATEYPIISLDKVPLTHGGKVKFQVENAMAAAAACWMVGTPAEYIRAGLESFGAQMDRTMGRFNLFDFGGATVIVDYGHNTSSLQAMLDTLKLMPHQRRTAVYSAAGDRRDEDMVRQGELLGGEFDRVILYEDQYLRGREQGEISHLFREGCSKSQRVKQIESFMGWQAAIDTALQSAKPGDLLLVQADTIDAAVDYMKSLQTETVVLREVALKDVMTKTKSVKA